MVSLFCAKDTYDMMMNNRNREDDFIGLIFFLLVRDQYRVGYCFCAFGVRHRFRGARAGDERKRFGCESFGQLQASVWKRQGLIVKFIRCDGLYSNLCCFDHVVQVVVCQSKMEIQTRLFI